MKGPKNIVADTPSRPHKQGDIVDDVGTILSFASKRWRDHINTTSTDPDHSK